MAAQDVRDLILAALEAAAAQHGVSIVDVEVAGSSKSPIVRARIEWADHDRPTITLDEVAEQSGWVGEVLDEVDPFSESYLLEVSSPGLDRPLRRIEDFERFSGQQAQIKLEGYEGRRNYTGTIEGVADGTVTVACDDGSFDLPFDSIRSARLKPTF